MGIDGSREDEHLEEGTVGRKRISQTGASATWAAGAMRKGRVIGRITRRATLSPLGGGRGLVGGGEDEKIAGGYQKENKGMRDWANKTLSEGKRPGWGG